MAEYTCAVDGCDRPYVARSMCDTHYRAWKRGRLVPPTGEVPPRPRNTATSVKCHECGGEFLARIRTTMYCSKLCLRRSVKRKHPTVHVAAEIQMERVCEDCGATYERSSRYGPTPRSCEDCVRRERQQRNLDAGYSRAHYEANRSRYRALGIAWRDVNRELVRESAVRYSARRRARAAGVESAPYTKTEIGERDGWVCYLCNEPVDPKLGGRDPASFSFDHVVPICEGGPDTPENVRTSHFICNIRKGRKLL